MVEDPRGPIAWICFIFFLGDPRTKKHAVLKIFFKRTRPIDFFEKYIFLYFFMEVLNLDFCNYFWGFGVLVFLFFLLNFLREYSLRGFFFNIFHRIIKPGFFFEYLIFWDFFNNFSWNYKTSIIIFIIYILQFI